MPPSPIAEQRRHPCHQQHAQEQRSGADHHPLQRKPCDKRHRKRQGEETQQLRRQQRPYRQAQQQCDQRYPSRRRAGGHQKQPATHFPTPEEARRSRHQEWRADHVAASEQEHGRPRAAATNCTGQFAIGPATAVPAYLRRAEDFMHAHCAEPIRLTEVAATAGCSVRALGDVVPRFRGKMLLAAQHAIQLEKVHAELSVGAAGDTVACRYGFTNPSRTIIAFRCRFGEAPSDVARRAMR